MVDPMQKLVDGLLGHFNNVFLVHSHTQGFFTQTFAATLRQGLGDIASLIRIQSDWFPDNGAACCLPHLVSGPKSALRPCLLRNGL
jgi:hypothetical protein